MESYLKSEISLPSYKILESMVNNIAMLNRLIYNNIFVVKRIEVGSTQGLNAKQCYLKLKSIISKMTFHARPKEYSLPSVFLDVLVLHLVNRPTPIRLQVERFIKEMESDNYRVHVISSNDNNRCVESQVSNEYNESIYSDNLSSKCGDGFKC